MKHLFTIFIAISVTGMIAAQEHVVDDKLMNIFPTLEKDGKTVMVSADEYITHHIKGVKSKYKLISVPDG